jgi:iron complex outermembrane receptor protein
MEGITDYGGTHLEARGYFESQQLKINVSYRFGKKLVKAARQRKISDDEKKRLNNSGGTGNQ